MSARQCAQGGKSQLDHETFYLHIAKPLINDEYVLNKVYIIQRNPNFSAEVSFQWTVFSLALNDEPQYKYICTDACMTIVLCVCDLGYSLSHLWLSDRPTCILDVGFLYDLGVSMLLPRDELRKILKLRHPEISFLARVRTHAYIATIDVLICITDVIYVTMWQQIIILWGDIEWGIQVTNHTSVRTVHMHVYK